MMCSGNMKGRVTAGTVSAALRELRPVEIVGLYEDVSEDFQVHCLPTVFVCVTGTARVHSAQNVAEGKLRTDSVSPWAPFAAMKICCQAIKCLPLTTGLTLTGGANSLEG